MNVDEIMEWEQARARRDLRRAQAVLGQEKSVKTNKAGMAVGVIMIGCALAVLVAFTVFLVRVLLSAA